MTLTGWVVFDLSETGSNAFLDDNSEFAAPPMASLRELEHAAMQIEKDDNIDSDEYYRWLKMLISPGSSFRWCKAQSLCHR